MTQEEKAKAYDEAIKVANKYKDTHIMFSQIKDEIFPELAESEDGKIRKWLIDTIKQVPNDSIEWETIDKSSVLAWLEKQGEQKKSYNTCNSSMIDNKKSPYGEKRDFGYFEEKPADKPEPKFKVGYKVYDLRNGFECTIESIDETTYYGDTTNFDIKDQDNWELVEQNPFDGGCVAEVYKNRRDRISISDITQWCYLYDLHKLSNIEKTEKCGKEEPVSEDLGEYINELSKQFPEVSFAKLSRIAVRVAKWKEEQMMEKAIDVEVKVDAGGYPYIPQMELYDYDKDVPLAKAGDRYKVILIKEE